MISSYQERNQNKPVMLDFLNDQEIWCFYLKSEFYLVSNKGRIKNCLTNRILKTQVTSQGYENVTIRLFKGKRLMKGIHRLILETFLPIQNANLYEVNHIDGNKLNNNLSNLEWMTRQENLQHARDNNLFKRQFGKSNGRYKHGKRCQGR